MTKESEVALEQTKNRRVRKQIINDPRLQFRFAAFIAGMSLALSLILGGLVYQNTQTTGLLLKRVGGEQMEMLMRANRNTILFLAIVVIVYIFGVALLTIFMTHRITGPLYNLRRRLQWMADGKLDGPISIRKTDELQDFALAVEMLRGKLTDSISNSLAVIERMDALLKECAETLEKEPGAMEAVRDRIDRSRDLIEAVVGEFRKYAILPQAPEKANP